MTYTKPEVRFVGRAIDAVQSHTKPGGQLDGMNSEQSSSAYEADE
jgi:hypothetical protein